MNLTRVTLATASSVLVLATLAACGSDSGSTAAGGAPEGGQAGPGSQADGRPGGGMPGASGEVAAVSGTTAQVQSQASGQVAVSWTGDTTFTQQVDATLADVTVGSCVVVTSADDDTVPPATNTVHAHDLIPGSLMSLYDHVVWKGHQFPGHWSWIYVARNDPSIGGTPIWQWMARRRT